MEHKKMSNLEIKIKMLETLYYLVEKGEMKGFNNFRKYVVAINEDMEGPLEYTVYRNSIDKISLAKKSFEVDDLYYAKESIELYKKIENDIKDGKIFYG
jgi:hypothetical protein